MDSSMYAAVDLGSNSFRLSIGQHDGGKIRVLNSMREPIRLAAGWTPPATSPMKRCSGR